ncbi:hypothetical protein Sjap_024005 [Stephania japonica]|uniref:Uncharacterized protein n=1 Tax=Stephania japonica TaxID=461633 RepID=A0AAP0EHY5_9MAGN
MGKKEWNLKEKSVEGEGEEEEAHQLKVERLNQGVQPQDPKMGNDLDTGMMQITMDGQTLTTSPTTQQEVGETSDSTIRESRLDARLAKDRAYVVAPLIWKETDRPLRIRRRTLGISRSREVTATDPHLFTVEDLRVLLEYGLERYLLHGETPKFGAAIGFQGIKEGPTTTSADSWVEPEEQRQGSTVAGTWTRPQVAGAEVEEQSGRCGRAEDKHGQSFENSMEANSVEMTQNCKKSNTNSFSSGQSTGVFLQDW